MRSVGVDEREDGAPKFFGDVHYAQRLAVPLWMGHFEVAIDALFRVTGFLLPDNDDFFAVKARQTANDRWVVGKTAIPVNLAPVGENPLDVVQGVRPLWMTRQFRLLPGTEAGVDLAAQRIHPLVELSDLLANLVVLTGNR